MTEPSSGTRELAAYLAEAGPRPLPPEVAERAKLHLLDTIAAMVSGSRLPAGGRGRAWAAAYGGGPACATVIGASEKASPVVAALANGMAAHADETDDSHPETLSHPGCAVVPAALAAAETAGTSGAILLASVVAGYDLGCRIGRVVPLKERDVSRGGPSSHAMVGAFGAAGAAAVALALDARQVRHALSYLAQLCSGSLTWMRDTGHVEKAFVFGGMPASQGLLATTLVKSGCDGVEDVFSGRPSWLDAFPESRPEWLARGLGRDYEVMRTTIKKYPVGSPAQAAVQAMVEIIAECGLQAAEVEWIEVRLPSDQSFIVDARAIPSINCQYLVAATLLDGGFSFTMAHDDSRMQAPRTVEMVRRVRLVADPELAGTRSARLEIQRRSGSPLTRSVTQVRGTAALPMTAEEVVVKARDLLDPVLGKARGEELCERVLNVDEEPSAAVLATLMNPV